MHAVYWYSNTTAVCVQSNRYYSLQQALCFVPTDSPYIDSYLNLYTTATSPQRQRPLKHVPNCENNFSTTAIFFSDWWKSQEWSWNLLRMALWWLKSRQLRFDLVSFIYCFLVAFIDKTKISRISEKVGRYKNVLCPSWQYKKTFRTTWETKEQGSQQIFK